MTDTQSSPTALFGIGNPLGSARLSSGQPHRIERLDVYAQVSAVLAELRDNGGRLGIVSDEMDQEAEEEVRYAACAAIEGFFASPRPGSLQSQDIRSTTKRLISSSTLSTLRTSLARSPQQHAWAIANL